MKSNRILSLVALGCCLSLPAAGQTQHGVSVSSMDTSVRPGEDFYRYANGKWIQETQIAADRSSVGVFNRLIDISTMNTEAIIRDAAKSTEPGSKKIALLYQSFLDEKTVQARGLTPIEPHLKAIAAIADRKALARALGQSLRADVDALNNTNFHTANFIGLWVAPGFNDPEHYAPYLLQGGLQLPDREYYVSTSEHMQEIRTKYRAHIATMLRLAGFSDVDTRADRVLALETAIARTHVPLDETQDIHKANNTWTPADFTTKAPGLDWATFFRAAGLSGVKSYIVWQPTAFKGEAALAASEPIEAWKDLLAFHLIDANAGMLPAALSDARFEFNGKVLAGVQAERPRWQRGVVLVNDLLGDEVGKIYAQRYFSPKAKAEAQEMVANIIEAFHKRIDNLNWMDPKTKAEAHQKLKTLYVGVGYPETWKDYSSYEVKADDLFGNLWRSEIWELHRQIARIGTPIDRHEWSMTPQTVNAVNLPLQNSLNFPAAILQPPFFDADAPSAANYGGIGTVIGHEISHTFDSEGAAFDSQGRVRNWWTASDLEHFQASTEALAKQYDGYEPFPGLHLNGRQTLGENIADVAGVAAAFDGYRASLQGKPAPEQNGLTGDQQFFLAYAQNWASKARENSLRRQIATDPHSPGEFRSDTVRNLDAWYEVFKVEPSEKLYLAPQDRVRIW